MRNADGFEKLHETHNEAIFVDVDGSAEAYHGYSRSQGMEQCTALTLLGMSSLIEDAVGQELLAAAWKAAVPIQEVQLRLALVVLRMVPILQCSSRMSLIDQHLSACTQNPCHSQMEPLFLYV